MYIQCSCYFSFNPNTGLLKSTGFTSDGTAYISAERNNEINIHTTGGLDYMHFNRQGGVAQVRIGNGAGGYGNLCSGTITTCATIKAGCATACTSTVTGKPGIQIICNGVIDFYGSIPYVDFHVNNACGYSSRLVSRLGRFDIAATNATGCTAATCIHTFCFCCGGCIICCAFC